jgi:MFS transporter, ACDE family, multidrug resistance protein
MNRQIQTVENDKHIEYSGSVMDRLLITLFFCAEAFSRGLLLAIIPLELLKHLGNTQRVTLFYAVVAIFGLGNSILVPSLLKRLGVRLIIALAGVFTTLAAVLLVTESPAGTALGLVVRVFASACIEISLLAYIMDRIPRHRLGAFEPIRIFFQGSCIAIAPWLGFQLHEHVSAETPYIVSATGGLVMLLLALAALPTPKLDSKAVALARRPIATVRRFFEQPRLRLAWVLAVIRSSFWVVFYIYASIFSVGCGWSSSAAAAILSLGTSTLFFVAVWGRLVRTVGARCVLMVGYGSAGIGLAFATAAAWWTPAIAPVLLLSAAFGASIIDGPGNIPFLRATRSHERPAMAGIYMTYRDVSQFAPIAVFSLILTVAQLTTAFLTFAAVLFSAAWMSRLIHPRLR